MATIAPKTTRAPDPTREDSPLPLENGDRMARVEFERRYNAMPGLKKAELIEAIVYMPSPVSLTRHGEPHSNVVFWLSFYKAKTPGVGTAAEASLRLDLDNEPQPDAMLYIRPEHGGQAKISEDGFLEGAPELVAEVSSSTVSIDLNQKLNVYRRNGVCEYMVWRVLDRQIDWFELRDGDYIRLEPGEDGIYRSRIFLGLWLDPEAMVRDDTAAVLETLQRGTTSPEHGRFVEQLAAQKR